MVTKIVEYIGSEIKRNSVYFNSYAVNVLQLPDGQIVKEGAEDEKIIEGIEDNKGVGFYIRVEPKAVVSKNQRQFTSCDTSHTAKQTCHLVAFNFEVFKDIDSDKWVNRLQKNLIVIPFSGLFNNNAKLELKNYNTNYIDNFIEETKKKFNVVKNFNCVKITFEVSYGVELQDCDFCDIHKDECNETPSGGTYYSINNKCFWD